MATATLPAYAHIRELRLGIDVQLDPALRVLNRKNPIGPRHAEIWRGEVLFADMARANHAAFVAWLAALDGRVEPLAIPFQNGFSSKAATQTGTLVSTVAYGARQVTLSGLGSAPLVGTMMTTGNIDTGDFWLFEITGATPSGANYVLDVAPRVRKAISSTAAFSLGAVSGKFRLEADTVSDLRSNASHGSVSINVIEAL